MQPGANAIKLRIKATLVIYFITNMALYRSIHQLALSPMGFRDFKARIKFELKTRRLLQLETQSDVFRGAVSTCESYDSSLVIMNTFEENKFIYDTANANQVDVWIGIYKNVFLKARLHRRFRAS